MQRRNPQTGTQAERSAARSLVLSGSLERRAKQIEQWLPPPGPIWVRAGSETSLVSSDVIRQLLFDMRWHREAGRYVAAKKAYDAAERLVRVGTPALRQARIRARAESEAARRAEAQDKLQRAGNAKKRRAAERRARPYISEFKRLRDRRREWTIGSIIEHIREHWPTPDPLSAKQIRRYLKESGLK